MKSNKGDTLVEVLVSIVVLAIIFISSGQMILSIKKHKEILKNNKYGFRTRKILEIFTIEPQTFNERLEIIYPVVQVDHFLYLYYDSQFNISKRLLITILS